MGSSRAPPACELRVTVGQRLYPHSKGTSTVLMLQRTAPLSARRMTQRILVVDDDPGLRELLDGCRRDCGYEVRAVADGAAMHDELGRTEYDLIVLDLMLPGDDG